DAPLRRAVRTHGFDDARRRRRLLTDGNINADQVGRALVDDRIHRDRGLARAAVADNEFTLAPAQWEQGVDRQNASLDRLRDQIALDNRGRLCLDWVMCGNRYRRTAIQRAAHWIDNTTKQLRPHRHADCLSGAPDQVTRL